MSIQPIKELIALLVVAHGSKNAEANEELHFLCGKLKHSFSIVEPAFLEIVEPTINQAGEKCVLQGAGRVIVLPYFLSPGVHARQDLENARKELAARFSEVVFTLANPIGSHPMVEAILVDRVREALEINGN